MSQSEDLSLSIYIYIYIYISLHIYLSVYSYLSSNSPVYDIVNECDPQDERERNVAERRDGREERLGSRLRKGEGEGVTVNPSKTTDTYCPPLWVRESEMSQSEETVAKSVLAVA